MPESIVWKSYWKLYAWNLWNLVSNSLGYPDLWRLGTWDKTRVIHWVYCLLLCLLSLCQCLHWNRKGRLKIKQNKYFWKENKYFLKRKQILSEKKTNFLNDFLTNFLMFCQRFKLFEISYELVRIGYHYFHTITESWRVWRFTYEHDYCKND